MTSFYQGLTFRDKTVDGHPDKVEDREAITLSEFTDRVYYNAPNTCVLNGMHGGKGKNYKGKKNQNHDTSFFEVWFQYLNEIMF